MFLGLSGKKSKHFEGFAAIMEGLRTLDGAGLTEEAATKRKAGKRATRD